MHTCTHWGVPGLNSSPFAMTCVHPLMQWLSSSGPTKVEWNLSKPRFLLYSNISADGNVLWENSTQRSSDWDIKNRSGSDSSSLSSETLSVYGHKERKTRKERQRDRERKAHCTWGTIRKAAPIEDWSRLLSEVYISAPEGAHTACFVPIGWTTWKTHTHAE